MLRFFSARTLVPALVTSALLVGAWGCMDEKPSVDTSTTEATVKGTVSFQGKPVTKGEVSFDPANYQRKDVAARKAPIEKGGTYTIKTLVGSNRVVVTSPDTAKSRGGVAENYFDVKAGDNTYNIDVK
jgi:hypothetical protein